MKIIYRSPFIPLLQTPRLVCFATWLAAKQRPFMALHTTPGASAQQKHALPKLNSPASGRSELIGSAPVSTTVFPVTFGDSIHVSDTWYREAVVITTGLPLLLCNVLQSTLVHVGHSQTIIINVRMSTHPNGFGPASVSQVVSWKQVISLHFYQTYHR